MALVGVTDPARIGWLSAIAVAGILVGAMLFIKVVERPFAQLISAQLLVAGATLMMQYARDYRVFLVIVFVHLVACGVIIPTLLTHATAILAHW